MAPTKIRSAKQRAATKALQTCFVSAPPNLCIQTPKLLHSNSRHPRYVRKPSLAMVHNPSDRPERYSPLDWIQLLVSLPNSRVLYRIRSQVIANALLTSYLCYMYEIYPDLPIFHMSPIPHQFIGTLTTFLLVFRTNSSYDRFWEGRKLWGWLINRCRSLANNYLAYFGHEGDKPDPAAAALMIRLVSAFPIALKNHLRSLPTTRQLEELSYQNEIRSKPIQILNLLSIQTAKAFRNRKDVLSGNVSAERQNVEKAISELFDILGACERIVKTPLPTAYDRHTIRLMTLWSFSLPLLIIREEGYLTILIQAFVAWAFYSMKEIGHLIEDPFFFSPPIGLNLEAMSYRIQKDCEYMLIDNGLPMHTEKSVDDIDHILYDEDGKKTVTLQRFFE